MGAVWFPVSNDLPAMLCTLELPDHPQYTYSTVAMLYLPSTEISSTFVSPAALLTSN